jgi:hypothetical protein
MEREIKLTGRKRLERQRNQREYNIDSQRKANLGIW